MINYLFEVNFASSVFLAFIFSASIVLCFGGIFIDLISRNSIFQPLEVRGPTSHQQKKNTPTMGGLLIVVAIVCSNLVFTTLSIQAALFNVGIIFFAGLGFLDDYLKISKTGIAGLSSKYKLLIQTLFSASIYVAYVLFSHPEFVNALYIPIIAEYFTLPALVMCGFYILVITSTTNSTNLTDGLDGLLSLVLIPIFVALLVITYSGVNVQANYDISVIISSILGGLVGFLWFNSSPAKIFMGDVGSMSLGFALAIVVIFIKQEFLLLLLGAILVAESLSVIIQVVSFKLRGKRVFRMSPLHHHFELSGLSEQKVVLRFFITSIILSAISVYLVL